MGWGGGTGIALMHDSCIIVSLIMSVMYVMTHTVIDMNIY